MGFKKNNQLGIVHGDNRKSGRTLAYNSWAKMIQRCTNKKSDCWQNYGGRGITVCDKWLKYSGFVDKHKAKIETEGKWTKGGPAETCDYNMRGNKRCRDDAPWEFAPGGSWD